MNVLKLLLSILVAALATTGWAQQYPTKPVSLVVAFSAGGTADALVRSIAAGLNQSTSATFVVDNRPGGNGGVAQTHVSRSAADGYVLLVDSADRVRGKFEPIAMLGSGAHVLLLRSTASYKSLADFRAGARSGSSAVKVGHSGNGSESERLAGLLFAQLGIKWDPIVYVGTGPVASALGSGDLDAAVLPVQVAESLVNSGKATPVAVTGRSRASTLPTVPTFEELGVKNAQLVTGYAMYAPPGTPDTIVSRIRDLTTGYLKTPDGRNRLRQLGLWNPAWEGTNGTPSCDSGSEWCECKKMCIPKAETCSGSCAKKAL